MKLKWAVGKKSEFINWQKRNLQDYKNKCTKYLTLKSNKDDYKMGPSCLQDFQENKYRSLFDCLIQAKEYTSYIHAIEYILPSQDNKTKSYIPIRFIPNDFLNINDKLLLLFDAFTISSIIKAIPKFGKIIYGKQCKTIKVKFDNLLERTSSLLQDVIDLQNRNNPPQIFLNKHCSKCEYNEECKQSAIEKDDISLLSGISKKEISRLNNKGIFTVKQLSYTFRPRRKIKQNKYYHSLKALALRENKIYISGSPKIMINHTPV